MSIISLGEFAGCSHHAGSGQGSQAAASPSLWRQGTVVKTTALYRCCSQVWDELERWRKVGGFSIPMRDNQPFVIKANIVPLPPVAWLRMFWSMLHTKEPHALVVIVSVSQVKQFLLFMSIFHTYYCTGLQYVMYWFTVSSKEDSKLRRRLLKKKQKLKSSLYKKPARMKRHLTRMWDLCFLRFMLCLILCRTSLLN